MFLLIYYLFIICHLITDNNDNANEDRAVTASVLFQIVQQAIIANADAQLS